MIMAKYLFLLFILLGIVACSQPCEIPNALDESFDPNMIDTSILPLQVGNKWTYSHTLLDSVTICVTTITRKVVVEDSLTYYEMVEDFNRGGKYTRLLRYRNPLEIEEYVGGKKRVYISLLDSMGTAITDRNEQGHIRRWTPFENFVTPAGFFPRCEAVDFDSFEPWTQYYFRGVGLVARYGMGGWHLKNAIVRGEKFGVW